MSEDFGSYLKHERELRGIPLDEVALTTKISIRFLQALEENRFDDLPGEVFIRGFIRSYGKAIGSNTDELLAAYHESSGRHPASATPDSASTESPASEDIPEGKFSPQLKGVLGFGAVLTLIVVGAIWVTSQDDAKPAKELQQTGLIAPLEVDNSLPAVPDKTESPVPEEESGSPAERETSDTQPSRPEVVGPAEPTVTVTRNESSVGGTAARDSNKNTVTVSEKSDIIKDLQDQSVPKPAEVSTEDPAADQSLKLVIRVNENAWFNLTVDDRRDQDFILPSGGSKTIEAEKAIVMTIGNRRATQLTLNDHPLEMPESPDNVIRNLVVNAELLE